MMTKIKLCGLSRLCDIETANRLKPEYVGFVFASKSKRYVSPQKAFELRTQLDPKIKSVGVFVREKPEIVADLIKSGTIDLIQLHGEETEAYIEALRLLTDRPVIKAFSVNTGRDIENANRSTADYVLLDSGKGGTGTIFDWNLLEGMNRPYFLAGGLNVHTVGEAVRVFRPYAVDVSSGIETAGRKDERKMEQFVNAVRGRRQEKDLRK